MPREKANNITIEAEHSLCLNAFETLIRHSKLFPFQKVQYYLFSKTGFTKGCMERAKEEGNVTLVSYEDIAGSISPLD